MAPDLTDQIFRQPPQSDWDVEHGYNQPAEEKLYPYKVYGTGKHFALMITLKMFASDIDYLCSDAVQGFKITFQVYIFEQFCVTLD